MSSAELTQEQVEWFRKNFCNMKNQELADTLGISLSSVIRMARKQNLRKSKEFMAAMQRHASACGARVTRAMGGNAGAVNLLKYGKATRFQPGVSNKDRMGEDAFVEMYKRMGINRSETFRKEKLRVRWGLEQKTRLRVTTCPPEKLRLRSALRRRGYNIDRASNEVFFNQQTQRSERMEAHARKLKMVLIDMTASGDVETV